MPLGGNGVKTRGGESLAQSTHSGGICARLFPPWETVAHAMGNKGSAFIRACGYCRSLPGPSFGPRRSADPCTWCDMQKRALALVRDAMGWSANLRGPKGRELNNMTTNPPPWSGWYRPNARHPWQLLATGATEDECRERLHAARTGG